MMLETQIFVSHRRVYSGAGGNADPVLSVLGQQQQFHAFAFGQRPFLSGHFGSPLDPLQRTTDPLAFRMPTMSSCQNMGQFGLNNSHHWGYSAATPYSSYLGAGSLSSCAASGGFNTPAIGFPAGTDHNQDTFHTASTTSSSEFIVLTNCFAKFLTFS
ncbi:hypothetical protein J6590_011383 [Homalodisca vitripennis]|nr:hypothetical protein J6590_011383 [Homalodisca vitripennis]